MPTRDRRVVPASRLGHRITEAFTRTFLAGSSPHPTCSRGDPAPGDPGTGRSSPTRSTSAVTTHAWVARSHLEDGTIARPARRSEHLEIMANGSTSSEGRTQCTPQSSGALSRASRSSTPRGRARDAAHLAEVAEPEAGIACAGVLLAESPDRADSVEASRTSARATRPPRPGSGASEPVGNLWAGQQASAESPPRHRQRLQQSPRSSFSCGRGIVACPTVEPKVAAAAPGTG